MAELDKDRMQRRVAARRLAREAVGLADLNSQDAEAVDAFADELRTIAEQLRPSPEGSDDRAQKYVITPMTDEEAREWERHTTINFGKFSGQKVVEVPMQYLVWLSDENLPYMKYVHSLRGQRRIDLEFE